MTSILRAISDYGHYLFTEAPDPRTRGWFLTGSPIPALIIMVAYHRFVVKSGPEFMKNRKPFNIDRIVQIYNVGQVVICTWLSYTSYMISYGPSGTYSWSCQPLDTTLSPQGKWAATLTWVYYMLKLLDLFDTIFFVMRKKFNQITFLHVYHHMGVILLGYIATKYYPDGHGFILVPVNCFVHSIMYTYYFLTNYNPEYKKKLWWKKYITQIQIIQFCLFAWHLGKLFFMKDCDYPMTPALLFLPQNMLIMILFINFYIKAYIKPNKPLKSS